MDVDARSQSGDWERDGKERDGKERDGNRIELLMFYHTISQSPDWELEKGMFVISWIIVHVPNLEIGNEMERNERKQN